MCVFLLIKDDKVLDVFYKESDALDWLTENLESESGLFWIEKKDVK